MRNKKQNKPRIVLKNNMLNYFETGTLGKDQLFQLFFNTLTHMLYNFAVIFGEMYKYTACLKSVLPHGDNIITAYLTEHIKRKDYGKQVQRFASFLFKDQGKVSTMNNNYTVICRVERNKLS